MIFRKKINFRKFQLFLILASQPFLGLRSFFLPKQFSFSFWRPGLGWRGLASQSWGGSWPADLADLEGWAVFFLPKQFFFSFWRPGLGWPGLAWADLARPGPDFRKKTSFLSKNLSVFFSFRGVAVFFLNSFLSQLLERKLVFFHNLAERLRPLAGCRQGFRARMKNPAAGFFAQKILA